LQTCQAAEGVVAEVRSHIQSQEMGQVAIAVEL